MMRVRGDRRVTITPEIGGFRYTSVVGSIKYTCATELQTMLQPNNVIAMSNKQEKKTCAIHNGPLFLIIHKSTIQEKQIYGKGVEEEKFPSLRVNHDISPWQARCRDWA